MGNDVFETLRLPKIVGNAPSPYKTLDPFLASKLVKGRFTHFTANIMDIHECVRTCACKYHDTDVICVNC